ncbi:MAG: glycosyltransferase [Flavobacterium sp.]|uniref:glycosyltransferase family 2 protein n=1 Tax=Flavobacterium sp. TaxID=239 RepID=UPI001212F9E1|nr:glycosyltransferase [Flavobacterium sp.]RZJ66077.1 MAG: glycosyltransferase [Flavobacterium sp.]
MNPEFAILICTKNRRDDLLETLATLRPHLSSSVTCVVIDDGSSDGTFESVRSKFPEVQLSRNPLSKGYLYCRNKMLNETEATYAISLDDDANFATPDAIRTIREHFKKNDRCGVIALRIFWGLTLPDDVSHNQPIEQVKSFVGCGHVWRMSAWKAIPDYPEWFLFYGEEDFASEELFMKHFSVDYLPEVLIQHRVDIEKRKTASDKALRLRRAIAAGWYLYFLHLPLSKIPVKFAYSIYLQLRDKLSKGDLSVLTAMVLAFWDLLKNADNIRKGRHAFGPDEFEMYKRLRSARISWKP